MSHLRNLPVAASHQHVRAVLLSLVALVTRLAHVTLTLLSVAGPAATFPLSLLTLVLLLVLRLIILLRGLLLLLVFVFLLLLWSIVNNLHLLLFSTFKKLLYGDLSSVVTLAGCACLPCCLVTSLCGCRGDRCVSCNVQQLPDGCRVILDYTDGIFHESNVIKPLQALSYKSQINNGEE